MNDIALIRLNTKGFSLQINHCRLRTPNQRLIRFAITPSQLYVFNSRQHRHHKGRRVPVRKRSFKRLRRRNNIGIPQQITRQMLNHMEHMAANI